MTLLCALIVFECKKTQSGLKQEAGSFLNLESIRYTFSAFANTMIGNNGKG